MRATAAYAGKLSHPIRLAVNKGLAGRDVANFLTVGDALELANDLVRAAAHAVIAEAEGIETCVRIDSVESELGYLRGAYARMRAHLQARYGTS